MHQEPIMNEQNSGKKFEGNWREIEGSLSEIFLSSFRLFSMVTQINDYVVNNRP